MSGAAFARVQADIPVLLVSADDQDHASVRGMLEDCRVHSASGRGDARRMTHRIEPWVVICDQILADGDWRDLFQDYLEDRHAPPLIVSSRAADDRLWAEVLNLGGYDLLAKPFVATEVTRVVKMAATQRRPGGGR